MLRLVRAAVPEDFCVIAVGGVETASDVQERLDAGATLVQGYTAFLYRGPFWGREINRGLLRADSVTPAHAEEAPRAAERGAPLRVTGVRPGTRRA